MSRAPFQVLVIPYRRAEDGGILYGMLQRTETDGGYWQWIAGGGEDSESPLEAAEREAVEEAGIGAGCMFTRLDSMAMIPVVGICSELRWGEDVLVVPEYAFGVEVDGEDLILSHEHARYEWLGYQDASDSLRWDSNRNALWELNHRLTRSHSIACNEGAQPAEDRLERQIRFILEINRLKHIFRRSYLADGSRKENDAEHSWHLAAMAVLLTEYASACIDVLRVLKMVLIHDLVEIDAGDTFLYDPSRGSGKSEAEQEAADRLFSLLPDDQSIEIRALWEEFEARVTHEARFARALDRLQPLLLNHTAHGRTWQEHGVTAEMAMNLNLPIIADGTPELVKFTEGLLADARSRGYFG